MATSLATIVVVPRETFRQAPEGLDRLLAATDPSVPIVYVDGGSPRAVARHVRARAGQRPFTIVRTEHPLTPNEARNLGARDVDTRYTVFLDNDCFVGAGWLEALVGCAEETGAAIVGPLYGFAHGDADHVSVHMAGGANHIDPWPAGGRHVEEHLHWGEPVAQVQASMERQPTEGVEFHCMLVRTDVLREVGPLDEGLMSINEHCDLCLLVRERGYGVWLEPTVVASYVVPKRLAPSDVPFFLLRWSEAWNRASLDRFADKWHLDPADPSIERMMDFGRNHRLYAYRPLRPPLGRVVRARGRVPRPLYDRIGHRLAAAMGERRRRRARAAAGTARS